MGVIVFNYSYSQSIYKIKIVSVKKLVYFVAKYSSSSTLF